MDDQFKETSESRNLIKQSDDFFRHVGNIFIKRMYFDFEENPDHREAIGHSHDYEHTTLLAYGSLRVECDGETKEYEAPAFIDIKANCHHRLIALVDKTMAYCIHDTRGMDIDDISRPYVGEVK